MAEEQQDRTRSVETELRRLTVLVLNTLALAAFLAALTVFFLALVVYRSRDEPYADWPDASWFAVLPLLVASATLAVSAWSVEVEPPRRRDPDDWG